MELADRSLHDLFAECQAAGLIGIPRDDLLRYLRDAAEALDYMNEKHNLQHLDVKPRNLFLIGDRVKVADFGLVKHLERQTASGLLGGVTPLYAAAGDVRRQDLRPQRPVQPGHRLPGTAHRASGRSPARTSASWRSSTCKEEPDLRSLPEAERPIVARALAKDPAKRFPNCMAFVAALYKAPQPPRVDERASEPQPVAAASAPQDRWPRRMEDIHLDDAEVVRPGRSPPPPSRRRPSTPSRDDGRTSRCPSWASPSPQPETGALRPTLIIGLGAFGRKALLELRCRFLDRFGDLNKLPLLRFLCIDTDPRSGQHGGRAAPAKWR